jgi:LysR family transcriptional regulator, pca operon transcriptional activator
MAYSGSGRVPFHQGWLSACMARRYLDQRLRLSLLRVVDALETHRSLLKASAVLGVTQPALTKSLRELEDILQVRLFDRHPRGVTPTDTGLIFVRTARRVLAELRRLDDELDELARRNGGTVALGALPVAAAGVLPGALVRLKITHPDITIRVREGRTEDLLPLLAAGEIDLIVGRLYEPASPDRFVREPLWTEPISILARPEHPIFFSQITEEALRGYDVMLPSVTQKVGQDIDQVVSLLGLTRTASLRSSSYGFIREMLQATDLIAVMPRLMMAGDLFRGTLKVVPLPIAAPDRPAGLIQPPERALSPAGEAFAACLRAYVGEIAERLTDIAGAHSDADRSDTTIAEAPR